MVLDVAVVEVVGTGPAGTREVGARGGGPAEARQGESGARQDHGTRVLPVATQSELSLERVVRDSHEAGRHNEATFEVANFHVMADKETCCSVRVCI